MKTLFRTLKVTKKVEDCAAFFGPPRRLPSKSPHFEMDAAFEDGLGGFGGRAPTSSAIRMPPRMEAAPTMERVLVNAVICANALVVSG
jgi:hypothetical protein